MSSQDQFFFQGQPGAEGGSAPGQGGPAGDPNQLNQAIESAAGSFNASAMVAPPQAGDSASGGDSKTTLW